MKLTPLLIAVSLIATPAIAQTKIYASTGGHVLVHTQNITVHDSNGERVPRAYMDTVGAPTGPDTRYHVLVFGCARGAGEIAVVEVGKVATEKSMYAWSRGHTKVLSLVAAAVCSKVGWM